MKLIDGFNRLMLSYWMAIGAFILNSGCFYVNAKAGSSDWIVIINIFGIVISLDTLCMTYKRKKLEKELAIEIEKVKARYNAWHEEFNARLEEAHKNHSDESNSDKT